MKRGLVFINVLITFLVSCQKEIKTKENNNLENSISMNNEISILKKQLGKGLKATIGDAVDFQIEYADEDVEIEGKIVSEILIKNGYKQPSNDEFNARMKVVFQRELDYSSSKEFIYINTLNPCNRNLIFFQNNLLDYSGFFVHKKNNFIAPLYTIPELIDYQKKYPEIIEYEKNISSQYASKEGEIKIHKWMDEKDLLQKRTNNIQSIAAQNKYLFNNSKGDLAWLKVNDKPFLESLVMTFGYVKDEDLLGFVLNNNYKNIEAFGKIICNKRCNGEIIFNQEVMDFISKSSPKLQSEYLNAVKNYIGKEAGSKNSVFGTDFSKKAEVLGKLAYYSEKIGAKIDMQFQFFVILGMTDGGSEYEKEFKKSNYYNIPDFKNVWEETKTGGVAYPGME